MSWGPEARLHELDLPDEILSIAHTHRDLPQAERARVEAFCTLYKEELASLHGRIARLELPKEWYTRKPLRDEVRAVQNRFHACKSLLSVLRRVPFEVMASIFEWCIVIPNAGDELDSTDDVEEEPSEWRPMARPAGLTIGGTLCLVCTHWNTIALATPSLWSTMYLIARAPRIGELPLVKDPDIRGLLSWTDRLASTPHPWSLFILANSIGHPSRQRPSKAGLGDLDPSIIGAVPLAQLLHRPAALHLQRLAMVIDRYAIGLGGVTFPALTSLVLGTWNRMRSSRTHLTHPDLPVLPALKRAVLHDIIPANTVTRGILPWVQLTHLSLSGIDSRQWRALIRLCTALQKGVFDTQDGDMDVAPLYEESNREVRLEELKELTFSWRSPFVEGVPMTGIVLPRLETLRFFMSYHDLHWDFANARNLYGALRHLSFPVYTWISGAVVIAILGTVPQLEELYGKLSEGYEECLEYLTYGRELAGSTGRGRLNRMTRLKAIGIRLQTNLYRPLEPEEDPEAVDPRIRPFPYDAISEFVASRTVAIPALPGNLQRLESLVLNVEQESWAGIIVQGLKDCVRPYVGHYARRGSVSAVGEAEGLRAVVWGPEDRAGNVWYMNPTEKSTWMHWEEGQLDCLEKVDEVSLYPEHLPFVS
ncbi:hypothetical protein DFP72DRAFT_875855 [Ephemerocybe angulata]|uniref:F-box domain-containing protein n=1 Tax=Ephemerocybe angulata TaxID=980116 RepID=A0A8H6IDL7_9AGAR|nr:hypothetical protein DFP72DRAFT_875855 [Tulosesus angulatus]